MRPLPKLDLPLTLNRGGGASLSVQLAAGLRNAIQSGVLRPGDRLPASRALALELSVSRGSVIGAYDQLAGEGYLNSTHGGGTFVAADLDFGKVIRSHTEPQGESGVAPALLDLTPGQPDTRRLPDASWRRAWRETALASVDDTAGPPAGLFELRQEVADHLRVARGFACSPMDVLITAGTGEGLALLVQALAARAALAGESLRAAIENPGYPAALAVLSRLGAKVDYVPVDDEGARVNQLKSGKHSPAIVFTTPSHQYPLGGRLPVARRQALLRWAAANSAIVVEDDYDSEFRHVGAPLPAMASLDNTGSVVHLGTFSKILTPSLRLGYLVAPPGLVAEMLVFREMLGNPVATQTQSAMANFLAAGGLRRHIARTRRDYHHRRELLIRTLSGTDKIRVGALDGGLHAVLYLPPGTDVPATVRAVAARGFLVADLDDYFFEGTHEPGLVLGYGGVTDTDLVRALRVVIDVVGRGCG